MRAKCCLGHRVGMHLKEPVSGVQLHEEVRAGAVVTGRLGRRTTESGAVGASDLAGVDGHGAEVAE